ncbi:histidine--tRNA ligase, cytoplasmic [Artemisia annua]|uniref:Histidine--tRNA ligase, cytoplasmic n=1 Tax=Artemisia annua TaxID=35608 RepID=A0A2U1M467_ARTAN|nr:histidine--tRNA ligase, cytoplasmic [Artemisia annua]
MTTGEYDQNASTDVEELNQGLGNMSLNSGKNGWECLTEGWVTGDGSRHEWTTWGGKKTGEQTADVAEEVLVNKRRSKHFDNSKKSRIPWTVMVGEREITKGVVTLRNNDTQIEKESKVFVILKCDLVRFFRILKLLANCGCRLLKDDHMANNIDILHCIKMAGFFALLEVFVVNKLSSHIQCGRES